MSWRASLARLRKAESAASSAATAATPATRPSRVAEVAEVATAGAPNLQGLEACPSRGSSGSSSDPAKDPDTIDLELEAASLIRRSGVEGLVVADLDLDTLLNVCHFAKLGTAARPGLKVWFKALRAAKLSESGLGLVSAPAGHGHLVAVARRDRWSRLLTIEQKVDSLALVEHLLRQAG